MKKKSRKPKVRLKDRNLGEEWIGIDLNGGKYEIDANTGKRIFMGLLLITILILGAIGLLFWYLTLPRLAQFHPSLPIIIGIVLLSLWLIVALWFVLMALSIWLEKDIYMRFGSREISITFMVPIVFKIGIRLGISKDKLSNSFVKVCNSIISTRAKKIKPENLLILLPRCLQKQLIERIKKFSAQMNIPTYIVGGGSKARQIVYKLKPKAIIGVACERDLLSGIKDVIDQIPVIGIPNIRPEGPCKDTLIDLNEFEKAVKTFLDIDTANLTV